MRIDINTAPIEEAIPYIHNCINNATEAQDERACAHFKHLL